MAKKTINLFCEGVSDQRFLCHFMSEVYELSENGTLKNDSAEVKLVSDSDDISLTIVNIRGHILAKHDIERIKEGNKFNSSSVNGDQWINLLLFDADYPDRHVNGKDIPANGNKGIVASTQSLTTMECEKNK